VVSDKKEMYFSEKELCTDYYTQHGRSRGSINQNGYHGSGSVQVLWHNIEYQAQIWRWLRAKVYAKSSNLGTSPGSNRQTWVHDWIHEA